MKSNPAQLFTFDGLLSKDDFIILSRSYQGNSDYKSYYRENAYEEQNRVRAFTEGAFWDLLEKAQKRLQRFDYEATLHPLKIAFSKDGVSEQTR